MCVRQHDSPYAYFEPRPLDSESRVRAVTPEANSIFTMPHSRRYSISACCAPSPGTLDISSQLCQRYNISRRGRLQARLGLGSGWGSVEWGSVGLGGTRQVWARGSPFVQHVHTCRILQARNAMSSRQMVLHNLVFGSRLRIGRLVVQISLPSLSGVPHDV